MASSNAACLAFNASIRSSMFTGNLLCPEFRRVATGWPNCSMLRLFRRDCRRLGEGAGQHGGEGVPVRLVNGPGKRLEIAPHIAGDMASPYGGRLRRRGGRGREAEEEELLDMLRLDLDGADALAQTGRELDRCRPGLALEPGAHRAQPAHHLAMPASDKLLRPLESGAVDGAATACPMPAAEEQQIDVGAPALLQCEAGRSDALPPVELERIIPELARREGRQGAAS